MAVTQTLYAALASAYTAATAAAPASYTETTGTGYARASLTAVYDQFANSWSLTSGATFSATGSNWTAGTFLLLFDASTAGNLIAAWPLGNAAATVASGASLTIGPALGLVMTAGIFGVAPAFTGVCAAGSTIGTSPQGTAITAGSALALSSTAIIASGNTGRVVIPYAATITPNAALGSRFFVTLTGNVTVNVPSNATPGRYVIDIVQDGTGSRTFTKGAGMTIAGGAPTATVTGNAIDQLALDFDGVTWRGIYSKAFA